MSTTALFTLNEVDRQYGNLRQEYHDADGKRVLVRPVDRAIHGRVVRLPGAAMDLHALAHELTEYEEEGE